jgi:alpha-ribazole phosphatase
MKIILIRHPETVANAKRLIYGRSDSNYTERGRASIHKVCKEMSGINIDAIYSSPLRRAYDLAKAIAKSHEKISDEDAVITDARLEEMYFGLFENKTNEEAREIYGKGYERFEYDFPNFQMPEGESMRQVKHRTVEFLKEMLSDASEKATYVVVAHAIVIRGALSFFLKIPLEKIWHIDVKPASLIEVSYKDDMGILTRLHAQAD